MIVCFFKLFPLIWNARIEDKGKAFIYQPFYMSMRKFCRIAF